MPQMNLNEADPRAKLIDPTLHSRGWMEDLIRREERTARIDIAMAVEFLLPRTFFLRHLRNWRKDLTE